MKKAYVYNENGYYEREGVAQIDPLESDLQGKNIYIMPANSTDKEPLDPKEGFRVKWDGEKWIYEAEPQAPEPIIHLPPTNEEQRQARANAYAVEVDPITAHIQRLKDETPVPEGEIAELIAERDAKVQEIKEKFPYSEV